MVDTTDDRDIFDAAVEVPRDGAGRFAPKEQADSADTSETLADDDNDGAETPLEAPAQAAQPAADSQDRRPNSAPPGVIEERRKRQEKDRENEELKSQLAQLTGTVSTLQALMGQNRAPQQQAPEPVVEDWDWVDPRNSVRQEIQTVLQQQTPAQMYNNRLVAEARFGEDKVAPASEEFERLRTSGQLDPRDYERVMTSPNPFAEAVKWYGEFQTRQTVGTDPNAWFEQELQKRMADPAFASRFQPQSGQQLASRGNAPFVVPSIGRAPGSAVGQQSGPSSEEDIYFSAPTKMGRRS